MTITYDDAPDELREIADRASANFEDAASAAKSIENYMNTHMPPYALHDADDRLTRLINQNNEFDPGEAKALKDAADELEKKFAKLVYSDAMAARVDSDGLATDAVSDYISHDRLDEIIKNASLLHDELDNIESSASKLQALTSDLDPNEELIPSAYHALADKPLREGLKQKVTNFTSAINDAVNEYERYIDRAESL